VREATNDLANQEIIIGLRDDRLQIASILRTQKVGTLRDLRTEELSRDSRPAGRAVEPSIRPSLGDYIGKKRRANHSSFTAVPNIPTITDWFESIFAGIAQNPRIVEEHDGASSLLPAVEAGIGVTLGRFPAGMSRNPFKLLRLQPEPAAKALCIAAPADPSLHRSRDSGSAPVQAARRWPWSGC
jgi:hypothetical protein